MTVIPEDTPVEISPGIWKLFGDPSLAPALPLNDVARELLRRHRANAETDTHTDGDWQSQYRVGLDGRMHVVILRTTWWREPREESRGFLSETIRFRPATASGAGFLTLMCLEDEWESLLGERADLDRWPRDN